MPRCTTCAHPDRAEIDRRLAAGEAERSVAKRFSVSSASVHRHKGHHLPATLAAATEAAEVARGDDLLGQVRQHIGELRALFTAAVTVLRDVKAMGDHDRTLKAIGEATRTHTAALRHLELLGKLAGELDERPTVNLLVNPAFVQVQAAILTALEPHPEALEAVRRALRGVAGG